MDELKRLFEKKNINAISQGEMQAHISILKILEDKANQLNTANDRLSLKFERDAKYVRVFKRAVEQYNLQNNKASLLQALSAVKKANDLFVLNQGQALISSPAFFEKESLREVAKLKSEYHLPIDLAALKGINQLVVEEYLA